LIIPAKKLIVVALRDKEEEVLRRLGELGVIQLKKPSERDVLRLAEEEEARLRELEELYERFMEIWRTLTLGVSETPEEKEEQEAYQRYNSLRRRLSHLEAEENELKKRLTIVKALIEMGEKKAPETGKFQDLFSIVGIISKKALSDVKRKISKKPVILKHAPISESEVLLHIIGIIDLWKEIVKILNDLGFRELPLKEISGDLRRVEEITQERLRRTHEEIQIVKHELEMMRASFMGFSPEEDGRLRAVKELHERFMELKKILSLEPLKHEEEVEIDLDEAKRIIDQVYERYNLLSARLGEIEDEEKRLEQI